MSTQITRNRKVGRPARVNLEQMVDAACEIGPDMIAVAERLGISVATMYRYVQGRDHLMQLVANKQSGRSIVQDRGQSWEEALREHARAVYDSYLRWPQLINQRINGLVGNPADSEISEAILKLMLDRGVEPADAIALLSEINQSVTGAAVSALAVQQLSEGVGLEGLQRRIRAECEQHGFDALRQCLDAEGARQFTRDYSATMERAIAAQRSKMEDRS